MNLSKYSSFIFVIICISILTITRGHSQSPELQPNAYSIESAIESLRVAIASGRLTGDRLDDLMAAIDIIQARLNNSVSKGRKLTDHQLEANELALASAVSEILAPDDVHVSDGPSTGGQVGSGGYPQGGPAAASSQSYVKESFGNPSLPVSVSTYAAAKNGNGGNGK